MDELLLEQCLVGRHVRHHHPQQEILLAGDGIALDDLVDGLHGGFECVQRILVLATEADFHEDIHRQAEAFGVEEHDPAPDHALSFEFLHPAPAGGVGKAYPLAEFCHGAVGVILQDLQDPAVEVIQLIAGTHPNFHPVKMMVVLRFYVSREIRKPILMIPA